METNGSHEVAIILRAAGVLAEATSPAAIEIFGRTRTTFLISNYIDDSAGHRGIAYRILREIANLAFIGESNVS